MHYFKTNVQTNEAHVLVLTIYNGYVYMWTIYIYVCVCEGRKEVSRVFGPPTLAITSLSSI